MKKLVTPLLFFWVLASLHAQQGGTPLIKIKVDENGNISVVDEFLSAEASSTGVDRLPGNRNARLQVSDESSGTGTPARAVPDVSNNRHAEFQDTKNRPASQDIGSIPPYEETMQDQSYLYANSPSHGLDDLPQSAEALLQSIQWKEKDTIPSNEVSDRSTGNDAIWQEQQAGQEQGSPSNKVDGMLQGPDLLVDKSAAIQPSTLPPNAVENRSDGEVPIQKDRQESSGSTETSNEVSGARGQAAVLLQDNFPTPQIGDNPSNEIDESNDGDVVPHQETFTGPDKGPDPSNEINESLKSEEALLFKAVPEDGEEVPPTRDVNRAPKGQNLKKQEVGVAYEGEASSASTPNLTLYSGTGSNNTYDYNSSNHVIDIRTSVMNNGTSAASAFSTAFFVSDDATIDAGDLQIGTVTQASLANGYYVNHTVSVDLDEFTLSAGTYYVGWYYDRYSQVTESNEGDNVWYIPTSFYYEGSGTPNLTIYTGSGSNNSYDFDSSDNTLDVITSVMNNGSAAAGSFRTGFYLSADATISTSDVLLGTVNQSTLANGYFVNHQTSVDLDDFSLSSGYYYVGMYYDDHAQVSESDESDNDWYFTTSLYYDSGTPNLTIYTGSASNNSYSFDDTDNTLAASTSIQNNGTAAAGSFRTGFYLSTDATITTSDVLIGTVTQSTLANGYFVNHSISSLQLDDFNLSAGYYYVGMYYDDRSQVLESDESDNDWYFTTSFYYPGPGAPNLTIYTGSASNNTYSFDDSDNTLDVSTSVQNNGTAAAGAFRTAFYLSTDAIISSSDILLGTVTQSTLANGYFSNHSLSSVSLDELDIAAGNYYVGMYYDINNEVAESDEGDNDWYFTTPFYYSGAGTPNLTIYTGSASNNSYSFDDSDNTLDVSTSVQNNGTAAAGNFRTGFYLSTDATITTSDVLIGTVTQSTLANGYFVNHSISSVDLDEFDLSAGNYYVAMYYDDNAQVAESDEEDNDWYFTEPFYYPGSGTPNLTLYSGSGSNNSYDFDAADNSLDVITSVMNNGTAAALSFRTGFYISTDAIISTSDVLLGTVTQSTLANGYFANHTVSVDLDDYELAPGSYYIGMFYDDTFQVAESDEGDNDWYFTTPVYYEGAGTPNLTIYTGSGSDNSYSFDESDNSLAVSTSVQNNGTAAVGSFRTAFYLSSNTTINTSDVLLGTVTQASLANGYFSNHAISVDVDDFEVSAGYYYVGMYYDDNALVAESDESDNDWYFTTPLSYSGSGSPNLTIYTGSGSNNAYGFDATDNTLDVSTSVQNNGTEAAGTFRTAFYISVDNIIDGTDELLGSVSQTTLAEGYFVNHAISTDLDDYGLVSGDYYVGMFFDDNNLVSESDESDNDFYFTTPLYYEGTGSPNLTIYTGSGSNNSYDFNADDNTLDVTTSVMNNGTAQAGSFRTGYYLSTDNVIGETDVLIGTVRQTSLLNGYFVNHPIATDLDDFGLSTGYYYIGMYYDDNGEVSELDESDNDFYFTTPIYMEGTGESPNLTIYTGEGSENAYDFDASNNTLAVVTSVQNNGTTSAGAFRTGFYLSTDNIITNSDVLLGTVSQSVLDNGYFAVHTISIDLDEFGLSTGDYFVAMYFDDNYQVSESDESDNDWYFTSPLYYEGSGTPNLTIYTGTGSDNSYDFDGSNNALAVNTSVQNNGTATANNFRTAFYLSTDELISEADIFLGAVNQTSLASGYYANHTLSADLDDYGVATGFYYVGMYFDDENNVSESDESDNDFYFTSPINVEETEEQVPEIEVAPLSMTISEDDATTTGATQTFFSSKTFRSDGISPNADYHENQIIVKFKERTSSFAAQVSAHGELETFKKNYGILHSKALGSTSRQMMAGGVTTFVLEAATSFDVESAISELQRLDYVVYAEPNYKMSHSIDLTEMLSSDDPYYNRQWGLKNTGNALSYYGNYVGTNGEDLNIEPAWDISMGSSAIIVAVIDDGVDIGHSEFAGRLVDGYDFVNEDGDPTPLGDDAHGTACAGIITAANDGNGVVGVAPEVLLMPIKSMQDKSGYTSDIIQGVYFAVENGADVISMSLGGSGYSAAFEEAVDYAVSNNVVVLGASGNANSDNSVTPNYPSSFASCISVGAMSPCGLRKSPTTCDEEYWWGSNYGDLDFITPGTRIYTTDILGGAGYSSDDYAPSFNGTSSATPFAAGVAALILSVDPTLTPREVRQIMQEASVDIGDSGYDKETGYGRLDSYRALQQLQSEDGHTVTIRNVGSGVLSVSGIQSDKDWLSFNGATSFDLTGGQSEVLNLSIDWSTISASDRGILTISSNDSDEPTVDVEIIVNPAGTETFEIAATADPEGAGNISGAGSYAADQTANLVANASDGYVFTKWLEDGTTVSTDASYSFVVTESRTLVASFDQLETFIIAATASPDEGGTVSGAGEYEVNETANLEATAATGYQFVNWSEDGADVSSDEAYSFTVTEDRTLTAHFELQSYTVTASADPIDGGTVTGAGEYDYGATAMLEVSVSDGYEFVNWTEDGAIVSSDLSYRFTVTGDRSLVANFDALGFTISAAADPSEGGSIEGAGVYQNGETATLVATPTTGYHFINWTEGGAEVSTEQSYSFEVTDDRTLVAHFELQYFNIAATAAPEEGGSIEGTGDYGYGATATLVATASGGYDFINWTEAGTEVSTEPSHTFEVTSDRVLTAHFELQTFTISASANPVEGGSVAGTGDYGYAETATLIASASEGYTFINWTEAGAEVSVESSVSFEVTNDRVLVANFELQTYTIAAVANPEEAGSVEGTGDYVHGEMATIVATPATGYDFINWTEDGVEVASEPSYSFEVINDRALSANFELKTYTLAASANPEEGGEIEGVGDYAFGATATMVATASEGYDFVNWTEDGEEVSAVATYSFEVTDHRVLVAHFELQAFVIVASADPEEGGSIAGAGEYGFGETATLVATAAEGYDFINWTEGGAEVLAEQAYSFDVTADRALIANFALQTFTIAATSSPEEGGSIAGAGDYDHGEIATLVATAATGYNFVNWTEDGRVVSTLASYSFIVSVDRTVEANFELQTFDIALTATPEEGGTVSGAGEYEFGVTATAEATASRGYGFISWTEDGTEVSTESTYSFMVTEGRSLVANFEFQGYEVAATATPEEGGTIQGTGTYQQGETATLVAAAADGYVFESWTEDGTVLAIESTISFEVTDHRSLVANFGLQSYEVTASANPEEGGAIEGAGTYEFGTTATLTATPNAGYEFVNWTEDGLEIATEPSFGFEVTGDRSLIAHFTVQTFTISSSVQPAEGGATEGDGTYEFGETATMIASAAAGFDFVNWTEAGEEVSNEATYSFEVDSDRALVANFSAGVTTSIADAQQEVIVYPNPFTDQLAIKWEGFERATVYALSGRKLLESSSPELSLKDLPAGTYMLVLRSGDDKEKRIKIRKN